MRKSIPSKLFSPLLKQSRKIPFWRNKMLFSNLCFYTFFNKIFVEVVFRSKVPFERVLLL